MGLKIDRCYCHQQKFASLKVIADRHQVETLVELQKAVTFGQQCKLCHPYGREMLCTGETVFHSLIDGVKDK